MILYAAASAGRVRHAFFREPRSYSQAICGRWAERWRPPAPAMAVCTPCARMLAGPPAGGWPEGVTRSRARLLPERDPFTTAAYLYRRECRWDFAPLVLADGGCRYVMVRGGRLVGFAVTEWWDDAPDPADPAGPTQLHVVTAEEFAAVDEEWTDPAERVVLHLWTAPGARRTGVATRLLGAVNADGAVRHYDGPLTGDGAAFVRQRPAPERRRYTEADLLPDDEAADW